MDLSFDSDGLLMPYTAVTADLESFGRIFVGGFPDSATRGGIFDNYLDWLATFKLTVCQTGFYQWIDGSFVTRKNNPNDLDIVTFVDSRVFIQKKKELQSLRSDELLKLKKLDCYFVELLPSDSRQYFVYQSDKMYWLHQFSYTKRNPKTDQRHEKGFIQINF